MNPKTKISQAKIRKALEELDHLDQLFPTATEILTVLLSRYKDAYHKNPSWENEE